MTDFNYAAIRPQQGNNLVEEAMQGYRMGQMPRWLAGKQKALDMENQLLQTRNQYAPQLWQQRLQALGLANQARQTSLSYLPQLMQSRIAAAGMGNQLLAEKLKYLPAMMAMQQQMGQARLSQLQNPVVNARNLSPLAKLIRERQNVQNLISPDGSTALQPGEATQLLNLYDSQMLKNTTDANTRKRLGFANQMDITLNSIDGNALTQYSGPQGKLEFIADRTAALNGHPSERYQKYMNNSQLAQEFVKQYRQFAGDSVQPSNLARINKMVDPSSWVNDPATAAQMFNTLASSARTEGDNLRSQALDVNKWLQAPTTDVYGNQSNPNNAAAVPMGVQAPQTQLRTSFDSKSDFDNYMASLSPSQRQQLKSALGIS